ncbi:hypothetical protein CYY_001055 [Polysphondylium violaceum]|uniref:EGF-like domain-containing protein n=1 Tax=Polysphondylium violaceum TaxID=133409 RepID=A0A8J4Q3T2_9MYCE|nr:hypothetical protein CYY_001055 [Polysphondylium violaceum]
MSRPTIAVVSVLVLLSVIGLSNAAAATPSITKLMPAWGQIGSPVSLYGQNFGANSVVLIDGTAIATTVISSDKLSFIMKGPSARQWSVAVRAGTGETSAPLIFYYAEVMLSKSYQVNEIVYIVGDFGQIPTKDKIQVSKIDNSMRTSATYINETTISFTLSQSLWEDSGFGLYDGESQILTGVYGFRYAPVVSGMTLSVDGVAFTGYKFSGTNKMSVNGQNCPLSSTTDTNIVCAPILADMLSPTGLISVSLSTGQSTTKSYSLTPLTYFLNNLDNNIQSCSLSLTNLDTSLQNIFVRMMDVVPKIISPNIISASQVIFPYLEVSRCSYAFLSSSSIRISNNLVICPTPIINSFTKPDSTNSLVLTVIGKFLDPSLYANGVNSQVLTFKYDYGDGSNVLNNCVPNSIWNPSDSTYTLKCTVSKMSPFKFYIETITDHRASVFVGYSPIITSCTSTNYLVPGLVTITGDRFSSFGLNVSIADIPCQNPQVSAGGTQIVCLFSSDKVMSDFSIGLPVKVAIESGYSAENSVFKYSRPSPVISTVTSLVYDTVGQVTIKGQYLYSSIIAVTIGGAQCASPVASSDGVLISCALSTILGAWPDSMNAFFDVVVTVDSTYSTTKTIFQYTRPSPVISSSSSTTYGTPGQVTLTGKYFSPAPGLSVTIGNKQCTNAILLSDTLIICSFASDAMISDYNTPLAVTVTINNLYSSTRAVFVYIRPNHVITSASSLTYGTAGLITIYGKYFTPSTTISITIGDSPCTSPISNPEGTQLTCAFSATLPLGNSYDTLFSVVVIIDKFYTNTQNVFKHTRPNPIIDSTSSTTYFSPGRVTLTGDYFVPATDILVIIGKSGECKNAILVTNSIIECDFTSDVLVSEFKTPLPVTLTINSLYTSTNTSAFKYIRPNPVITSATPTKYLSSGQVTIAGDYFISPDSIEVTIGGDLCDSPIISHSKQITCMFKSTVKPVGGEPLEVTVTIDKTFIGSLKAFLYTKEGVTSCPLGSNNLVCSNHGTCNLAQFQCLCDQGWESSDCSIENLGAVSTPPTVNENNSSTTISTPSGNTFDVGLVMINELDSIGTTIIQSVDIGHLTWGEVTKSNNTYRYKTQITNNNSTLLVTLTINNLDQRQYYNFAGDIMTSPAKLYNEQSTTTTTTKLVDGSVRNVQMTLNGETLIGTFSDRMIVDNRPAYNKVNQLTVEQITAKKLDKSSSTYISISTPFFKSSVVVDPNFGMLVSSAPSSDECESKGMPSWKLAVIIVCSVVGVSLIVVAGAILFRMNATKVIELKHKMINLKKKQYR